MGRVSQRVSWPHLAGWVPAGHPARSFFLLVITPYLDLRERGERSAQPRLQALGLRKGTCCLGLPGLWLAGWGPQATGGAPGLSQAALTARLSPCALQAPTARIPPSARAASGPSPTAS